MGNIFEVNVASGWTGIKASLPITPYQVLDLFAQLQLRDGERLSVNIEEHSEPFDFLYDTMSYGYSFNELNDLALHLSALDEDGQSAFKRLVEMESTRHPAPLSPSRLTALARSIGACSIYPGYTTPDKPDYAILMKLAREDAATLLSLPAAPQMLDSALQSIGASDWNDPSLDSECMDCAAPPLIPFLGRRDGIVLINCLAQKLQAMDGGELTKLNAVLVAAEFSCAQQALQAIDTLDEYQLMPQYISPSQVAIDYLVSVMGEESMLRIYPYVDLVAYGNVLLQDRGHILTPYGIVSCKDGQSLRLRKQFPEMIM